MASPPPVEGSSPVDAHVVLGALAGFWGCFIALYTARAALMAWPHQGEAFVRRVIVASVGMALAWLIYRMLARLRPAPLRSRIWWAAAMSLPAAVLFAGANVLVFNVVAPISRETCSAGLPCGVRDMIAAVSDLTINWAFVFAAWGLLYLSLASAAETRAADRRVSAHREAARLAEIRSLRYQINPHFLFNLLNTLSSLVIRRQLTEAEELIGEIGRFLRYSLAADPVADSVLCDEIAMQGRYLDLERRRFPSRLHTRFEVAEAVSGALAPSLILQPLVENAIKHGVARTAEPVTLTIRADQTPDGRLRIVVEDDARPAQDLAPAAPPEEPAGLGIGLRNVADRLRARFGAETSCLAGPRPTGGFRVELVMPLVLA